MVERRWERGIPEPELITQLDSLRPHLARAAFLSARLALERLCTLASALETVGLPTAVLGPAGRLLATNELPSFTRRLIDIAGAYGSGTSPTAALNAMRLPAIALDQHGFVSDLNAAADAVFDDNIKIKDKRLFIRDPGSRTLLKSAIDQLKDLPRLAPFEPVESVPRIDKLPVIVRIWPFDGPAHPPGQDVRALLTLNALGQRPGPPAGDPRQDVPPDAFGSQARLHHRARRPLPISPPAS